jgi:hypothetical protein
MAFFIIDDRDPKITYTGTWNLGGTAHEYNGTVSSSIKVGNHFSVPFSGVYSWCRVYVLFSNYPQAHPLAFMGLSIRVLLGSKPRMRSTAAQ